MVGKLVFRTKITKRSSALNSNSNNNNNNNNNKKLEILSSVAPKHCTR
jgi:hypothetical protein